MCFFRVLGVQCARREKREHARWILGLLVLLSPTYRPSCKGNLVPAFLPSSLSTPVAEEQGYLHRLNAKMKYFCPCGPLRLSAQGVKDWEAVLHKAKGMFLKCPPRELILKAPTYMRETLGAGG